MLIYRPLRRASNLQRDLTTRVICCFVRDAQEYVLTDLYYLKVVMAQSNDHAPNHVVWVLIPDWPVARHLRIQVKGKPCLLIDKATLASDGLSEAIVALSNNTHTV